MKIGKALRIAGLALAASIAGCSSLYVVNEQEQAVVTRMGDPVRVILGSDIHGKSDPQRIARFKESNTQSVSVASGAGVYMKVPFIDRVQFFDDRILEYDAAPREVVTKDKKSITLDNYGRWRIFDPLRFLLSVNTEGGAIARLDDMIYASVSRHASQNNLIELVRTSNNTIETTEKREFEHIHYGRERIMAAITKESAAQVAQFGCELPDVRIMRAELPQQNLESVYDRMRNERQRIAQQYRAEGDEQSIKITSAADMQVIEITSEADRIAKEKRGQADAEAWRIYNDAYGKDPEFFRFLATMDAYKGGALDGAKLYLSEETDFNRYLKRAQK